MEKLKNVVPESLKRRIGESTPGDLLITSTCLLENLQSLPLFHQVVGDLADMERALCGKNMETSMKLKIEGNECFAKGDYKGAIRFYSQALRVAPTNADDLSKDPVALLYNNRASAFYKMGLLMECIRDTTRALSIFPAYAKAWFRRGKAYASLGHYEDAVRSLRISLNLEISLSGKRLIEREIEMIIGKPKGATDQLPQTNGRKFIVADEAWQVKIQAIATRSKGRGMVALADIPEASLIHKEDPFAAIILKDCRETHCHFCFRELPVDTVPCSWCSISLYCSEQCQVQAGGQRFLDITGNKYQELPDDLVKYISDLNSYSISDSCKGFTEHSHECQGTHWPLVLPSEIVLAGRVLAKHIEQHKHSGSGFDFLHIWDLFDNYAQLPPESKLEFHIYSIILLQCLQYSFGSELPVNGKSVSEVIILLSQIRVNSMAVVCLKSSDLDSSKSFLAVNVSTASMEQVKVGQAVYSGGSLFNHSCLPNIHSYFFSRTLCIRTSECVAAGSHLELSYGPQVGQLESKNRQKSLEGRYSFQCECRGCAQPNLSDLVINGYRCVNPNCLGVVLDKEAVEQEKKKFKSSVGIPSENSFDIDWGTKLRAGELRGVVSMLEDPDQWKPGYCLNCQSPHDIEVSYSRIREAEMYFRRLEDAVASNNEPTSTLSEALQSVDLLRKILHPYNKRIAKVEDTLAQAFCLRGEFQEALHHCLKSIEVLIKLYGPNHIAIGNELIKVASIQTTLRDHAAAESLNRAAAIFHQYYGSDADQVFPLLQNLRKEIKLEG